MAADFDPLVRAYRALEFVAFGGDLERARFCLTDALRDCRSILILGEGDGRFLAQLLPRLDVGARVQCVDASAAMLRRAEARVAGTAGRDRVTFQQADALALALPPQRYDAVVTLFFIDCFQPDDAAALVEKLSGALQPKATWLFADFVEPPRGFARWRARIWLAVLYTFFRWQTGLKTRALPPSEELIAQAGFARAAQREFQWGLLRAVAWRR